MSAFGSSSSGKLQTKTSTGLQNPGMAAAQSSNAFGTSASGTPIMQSPDVAGGMKYSYNPNGTMVLHGSSPAAAPTPEPKKPETIQSPTTSYSAPASALTAPQNEPYARQVLPYDPRSYGPLTTQMAAGAGDFQTDALGWRVGNRQLLGEAGKPNAVVNDIAAQSGQFQNDVATNMPFNPRSYDDLNTYRGDVSDAFYGRESTLLAPMQSQQRESLEQDLADRGIPIGSEAYNDAMGNLERGQFDQNQRIAYDAVIAGGQESQRQLGMEQALNDQAFNQTLGAYGMQQSDRGQLLGALQQGFGQQLSALQNGFATDQATHNQGMTDIQNQIATEQGLRGQAYTQGLGLHQQDRADAAQKYGMEQDARQRAITEQLQQRNQALNELALALGSSPQMPLPQAPGMPTWNIQAPDIQGLEIANYNGQVNAANARAQAGNGAIGAFGSLLGGFAGLSHSSFKRDIAPAQTLCEMAKKMPARIWRYDEKTAEKFGVDTEPHVGPLAEEWHASTSLGNGVTVNFMDLAGFCLGCVQELTNRVEKLETA